MIPVFISRPNPFTDEQEYFLKKITEKFIVFKFSGVTLEAADYNIYDSLSCLDELIKRCYGIAVIAFGQSYIQNGTSKKGALDKTTFWESSEKSLDNSWITSPFCHIEGALGIHNRLPLLILEQDHVKIDGILKKGGHAISAPSFQLDSRSSIDDYFSDSAVSTALQTWSEEIYKKYSFINNRIV